MGKYIHENCGGIVANTEFEPTRKGPFCDTCGATGEISLKELPGGDFEVHFLSDEDISQEWATHDRLKQERKAAT